MTQEPKWMVEYDGNTIVLRTIHGAIALNHEQARKLGEALQTLGEKEVRTYWMKETNDEGICL